jgi:hypothetical protein
MEKNWLIRTKSNHILGPVSKEKVLELYSNGSIKPDDEICSGNGYWFFIREDDLVNRFLKGSETQTFNPISEAKDVLTQTERSQPLDRSQDDITLIGSVNLGNMKQPEPVKPKLTDPPAPQLKTAEPQAAPALKKKSKPELAPNIPQSPREKKVHKTQGFLQYLFILGFILLVCAVYFRKNLIRAFLSGNSVTSIIIPVAQAQEKLAPEKKKSF